MAQVGIIEQLSGVVQAIASDGSVKVLVIGDVVNEGDVITTIGNDSSVKIDLFNGKEIVLGADERSLLDNSVVSSEVADNGDVTAIQQALLDGGQLPTEAPAVGPDTLESAGGITEAYIAQMSNARGDVSSYNLGTRWRGIDNPDGNQNNQNNQINHEPIGIDDVGIATEEGNGREGQYDAPVVAAGNVLGNDLDDGLPNPYSDLDVSNVVSGNTENKAILGNDGNYTLVGEFGTLVLNAETGAYSYVIDNKNIIVDKLNISDTLRENFTYTVTDGLLDNDANLTITINGTNDAPIISIDNGDSIVGSIIEDTLPQTASVSGTISFNDVDINDFHTVTHVLKSVGYDSNSYVNIASNSIFGINPIDLFSASQDGSEYQPGDINWNFTIPNSILQPLGSGETIDVVYSITVTDANGKTDVQDVTITITGTNDAPVITTGETDLTFVSEAAGYNNVLGMYTFDENGNPTDPQIVLTDTNNHDNYDVTQTIGLPMGSFGIFIIANGETSYPDIDTSDISFDLSGTIPVLLIDGDASTKPVYFDNNDWNPSGRDHFDTTVNDDGSLRISIEDLNMGDNDRVDLVVDLAANGASVGGTVVEIADGTNGENIDDISTSGTLNFDDIDLSDSHTVSAVANDTGYLGTFTSSITTSAIGAGAGEISWSFSVNDSLVDGMGADESIVQIYTITIDDGHGGTDTQEIAITIQGTNDRPIAFNDTSNGTENQVLTIDVLQNDTDADINDTISINTFDTTTSGGGTVNLVDGKLEFNPGSDFDYLGAGDIVDVTFNYTTKDNSLYITPNSTTATNGISDLATVTITITGTNDAPTAVASVGTFSEDTLSESIVPIVGSENLLTGVTDVDDTSGHIVGKVSTSDSSYSDVDATDGTLVKVAFTFTNVDGNDETIFVPVRVNQDGTYAVSQNELLDGIPKDGTATGSFWYQVDDGHTQNNLSDGQEFTITIAGQNDAPEFNVTSLDNGDTSSDIPVIIKLSGDRFNNTSGDAPTFNILVDGIALNAEPLTIEELRSYGLDSSLGTETKETSWEYVTFNVASDTQNVAIEFVKDSYEGGSDSDGDGYSEDRNLIVDSINIGGKIETDASGEVNIVGGVTLEAEDTSVATYTASNGVDVSGREIMAWQGTMTFDIESIVSSATPTDGFQTETFGEDSISDATDSVQGSVNLLAGVTDEDGLISDVTVVDSNGANFTNPITVALDVNDANGDPLNVEVTVNSDGTYSVEPNSELDMLAVGTTAEGTFTYKAKDVDGGLSQEQTFTIRVDGINDAPEALDDGIFTTNEDTSLAIGLDSLLSNDSDVESDTLSIQSVQNSEHGTVEIQRGILINQDSATNEALVYDSRGTGEEILGGATSFDISISFLAEDGSNSILSYAAGSKYSNDVLLYSNNDGTKVQVWINGTQNYVDVGSSINDGKLHDIRLQWQSTDGEAKLSVDGDVKETFTIAQGETIAEDGVLMLGQEQDSIGGNLDSSQVLSGEYRDVAISVDGTEKAHWQMDNLENGITEDSIGDFDLTAVGDVSLLEQVVFTPDADYSGDASFEYTINDGNGATDTATVHMYVNDTVDIYGGINFIQNGSFDGTEYWSNESSGGRIESWTASQFSSRTGATTDSGDLVELDVHSNNIDNLSQTISNLTESDTYLLKFDAAMRDYDNFDNEFKVLWNGEEVSTIHESDMQSGNGNWETFGFEVTAGSGDNILTFIETSDSDDSMGPLLDNVQLYAEISNPTPVQGLFGTDGSDNLVYGNADNYIDGKDGEDTLQINTDTLDLSNVHNIEIIELSDSAKLGDDGYELTAKDVFEMTNENHNLTIAGNGEVDLSSDWTVDTADNSIYSAVYSGENIILHIDDTSNINIV